MDTSPKGAKPRVVVTHWIHAEAVDALREFCDPILNETRETLSNDELMQRCREAEGIIVFMPDRVDKGFLAECPHLKAISAALKGYDNFDVAACRDRGVAFSYVDDLLTIPTAELAVGLMISLARNVLKGDARVRSGDFTGWRPVLYGTGLHGATVGLIGCGAVGKAFAKRLQGFDCRLIAHDQQGVTIEDRAILNLQQVGFQEVVEQSDFLVLLLPLNSRTRHLINEDVLQSCKEGAMLINVCRGSVVDEEAVADALDSGQLGGYAADVFEMEDWAIEDRPRAISERLLRNTEKTLLTPHLGSAVDEVRKEITMRAVSNLRHSLAEDSILQAD